MKKRSEKSSGNGFADLGFPNSEQELVKAKLTVEIYRPLKARGLTQTEAAKLLGTTQAQMSALMRCRPVSVSVGRLMEFLTILGQDVELTQRETEVLKWAREGKSRWETSVILKVSEETVKFHMENALQKLKAVNRAQAVAIAMEHDLLKA
ncbi:MAG: Transcriptional activator protein LuxR [Syntrophorhabdus sp. PtaB.Bin184]|nr:MAG: Transcriptional activator protein LuxR [Syntrophorhabdus sp. PtaB.Bin184]